MTPINFVIGDATSIAPVSKRKQVLAHVCNNAGIWGAGFSGAVSKKWPYVEQVYRTAFRMRGELPVGVCQMVAVSGDVAVANLIAMRGVRSKDNPVPIDYTALYNCLDMLSGFALKLDAEVRMPRIGCGLAGGRWNEVEAIIKKCLSYKDIPVFVYSLPGENW